MRLVRAQLFALRFAGIAMLSVGLVAAAVAVAVVSDALQPYRTFGVGEIIVIAVAIAMNTIAVYTFIRGRRPRASRIFRLLTADAHSIRTLRFVNIVHRPYCHVFIGHANNKTETIVCYTSAEQMLTFFTRLYPHAEVVRVHDPRPQGPSSYA